MSGEAWLVFWVINLAVSLRVVWGWWRFRFRSPIDVLNEDLVRLRRQRRR